MTDPTPNRPPLWQVMSIASGHLLDETFGEATDLQCRAAELRALADWLVPQELPFNLMEINSKSEWAQVVMRDERQRIRAVLLAEADRAEAGE
jgi:hypothetical protein